VSKQLVQWNSGTTRESHSGPRAQIPSALTTKPLNHMFYFIIYVTATAYSSVQELRCFSASDYWSLSLGQIGLAFRSLILVGYTAHLLLQVGWHGLLQFIGRPKLAKYVYDT